MFLQFSDAEGKRHVMPLSGKLSVTIGRSTEADISVADTKISKLHAEIRAWDKDYVIKDLHSRNGIYVNGVRSDVAVLKLGDTIRIGSHEFLLVKDYAGEKEGKGTTTIVREVAQELDSNKKGYRTILREIVQSTDPRKKNP